MNIFLIIVTISCFSSAYAWEVPDMVPEWLVPRSESIVSHEFIKVTEPFSCMITQQQGPINIKGWDKDSVSLKITQKGSKDSLENTVVTLNKDKLPKELSLSVAPKNIDKSCAQVTVEASVPYQCALTIQAHKGQIKTKNLSRAQTVSLDEGTVGIVLTKFGVESSVFIHNKKGMITVKAPKKIQAQLAASTLRGTITSELFITLMPQTTMLDKDYWHRVKKEVNGFLGDGGGPITLEAEYGDIKIVTKK